RPRSLRSMTRPAVVQAPLPVERLAHDVVQFIARRLPAEDGLRPIGASDDGGRIARPPRRHDDLEIDAGHLFDDVDHLPDRLPVAVAAIADETLPAPPQIGERV